MTYSIRPCFPVLLYQLLFICLLPNLDGPKKFCLDKMQMTLRWVLRPHFSSLMIGLPTSHLEDTLPSPDPSNQILLTPSIFPLMEPTVTQLGSCSRLEIFLTLDIYPSSKDSVTIRSLRSYPLTSQLPSPPFGPSLAVTQPRAIPHQPVLLFPATQLRVN